MAHQKSLLLKSQLYQSMNSPVALKMAQRVEGVKSGGGEPDPRDQLLLSNILTKSLGMPTTMSLNQKGAGGSGAATKKHNQEGSGIFKILKDFEE